MPSIDTLLALACLAMAVIEGRRAQAGERTHRLWFVLLLLGAAVFTGLEVHRMSTASQGGALPVRDAGKAIGVMAYVIEADHEFKD